MTELPIKNEELDFTYNMGEMGIPLPERHREKLDKMDEET